MWLYGCCCSLSFLPLLERFNQNPEGTYVKVHCMMSSTSILVLIKGVVQAPKSSSCHVCPIMSPNRNITLLWAQEMLQTLTTGKPPLYLNCGLFFLALGSASLWEERESLRRGACYSSSCQQQAAKCQKLLPLRLKNESATPCQICGTLPIAGGLYFVSQKINNSPGSFLFALVSQASPKFTCL